MLFIVTVHDQYYPVAGHDDWRLITTDEAKARDFLDGVELKWCQSAYLISIVVDPRTSKGHSTEIAFKAWKESA